MAAIDQVKVQAFIAASAAATTTSGKGRALEDLLCYIFGLVPGISITLRDTLNAFSNEEIDIALWNDGHPNGVPFLPSIILVECKNWSAKVGSIEVNWFDSKLRNRGLQYGVIVAYSGITGDPAQLTAAHNTVAAALREARRLIVIDGAELTALLDTDDLVKLFKTKLCALAVNGTIV